MRIERAPLLDKRGRGVFNRNPDCGVSVMRTLNIESNHSSVLRGITVTEVLVAIAILAILFLLLMPAVQQSRESARRLGCSTNLKQIGTAIENYHASYRVYPGAFVRWPHELLPYLEQTPLHKKLQVLHQNRLARIEDRELIEEVHSASVPIYVCPSDSYAAKYHGWNISYRMNDGYWPPKNKFNGFFQVYTGRDISNIGFDFRQTRSADMTDGQSNTAALSEMLVHPNIADLVGMLPPADHPQIWRRTIRETWWVDGPDALDEFCRRCEFEPITPVSQYYSRDNHLADLSSSEYGHELPPNRNSCLNGTLQHAYWSAITASSMHPGGVNLLLADGSVRFVGDSIDRQVWRALGSRNGNDIVNF